MSRSFSFTHAICRAPSPSIVDGLRAVDTGAPDLDLFRAHHAAYVDALRDTGANVTVLPALDAFPDSVFVEDAALCLTEGAIVMRPGAPSRRGEAAAMRPTLETFYDDVREIDGPGFIEGGDILVTESEILVGTSARTDAAGVDALRALVADWDYRVREVQTPPDVLHFKTDCSLLDADTILCTRRLAASGCFDGYRQIHTADGEEAAANAIRFNQHVLLPKGFPRTAETLGKAGYDIRQIGNSEAAKLDGGMSCLSLRFRPAP
ncbi:dimethylarginine dimethylaminohydrolase family protein [Sulfitobacter aestuariivivens]|uniref:Dimethylarginine dimethylaminohydrolase n=1 Tax=Sulfitobacter aestuariivivens TaxID=2766981 RepID=A0A927HHV6_9RHOB|nr:arginine deiminase family protein [Sulfitobacter aestuariivivens]MBD3665620.1 dimethylarginine dimethylaminohydrolase [Sulfitobacter aestuariivivens]